MAQKTKVKELVGRGLNSYHTKSLQQIDRIEKKNKEQNHKISILTNELDNDYLTKTEEGSVVSLEHSKEGMVYLDELQGNTLVNYCTDGSKEMTLNGDIDVEGTFVTTTEGVDNGKIDVLCEGNTLVNYFDGTKSMISKNTQYTVNGRYQTKTINTFPTKVGDKVYFRTKFSVDELNTTSEMPRVNVLFKGGFRQYLKSFVDCEIGKVEEVSVVREHPQNLADQPHMILEFGMYSEMPEDVEVSGTVCKYTVYDYVAYNLTQLFGAGNEPTQEWCDQNLPYIEGMKSVGECEDNKIEILSSNDVWHNKGFTRNCYIQGSDGNIIIENNQPQNCVTDFIQVKPNTTYTRNGLNSVCYSHVFFDENKNRVDNINATDYSKPFTFTTPSNCKYLRFKFYLPTTGDVDTIYLIEGTGTEKKSNKKEILMNEPLRRLPNEVKDRIAKIGNKWFIERKLKQVTLNSSAIKSMYVGDINVDRVVLDINFFNNLSPTGWNANLKPMALFETINWKPHSDNIDNHWTWFHSSQNTFHIICPKGTTLEQAIEKLDGCNVVYQIDAPIYEPLGVEPILNTYTDVTHISNSSVIPCNMKIKNSGYNTIIKPSTLYTVALDTNKSGTIGMNLGGAKGTTTNNVLKLTTPATLADDSLRLYGKGIKGSKVRLLEGDKTNWIPSYFEGMKSSFEDKLQDDGTYKMEILSNNENLFDLNGFAELNNFKIVAHNGKQAIKIDTPKTYKNIYLKSPICIKGGETYKFSGYMAKVDYPTDDTEYLGIILVYNNGKSIDLGTNYIDTSTEWKHIDKTFSSSDSCQIVAMQFYSYRNTVNFLLDIDTIRICKKGMENITKHQSNKIQFSSIEPLRGVNNVKDRFVFKDGKMMIERNVGYDYVDGLSDVCTFKAANHQNTDKWYGFDLNFSKNHHKTGTSNVRSDNFKFGVHEYGVSVHQDYCFVIRIPRCDTIVKLNDVASFKAWFKANPTKFVYELAEPTYEEIPFELQKIILEGYENGTIFFDTNIPPTSTVTYAGETPIVKATKLNKTEVLNNTNDINDNIIPYLMDMDYRVVCLQLQSENINDGVSMARLFGGTYEMLQRDIQSKRYSEEEYKYRLDAYLDANKITEEEYNKLGDMLNE